MATIGNTTTGTDYIESGPTPLVTDKTIGSGNEGSFDVGYIDAAGGEIVTEYHLYCKTRDSSGTITAEVGIYTYDRQHNDQDFNGVPIALFSSSIEDLSPAVTRTLGWKTKTGLSYKLNDDDYCICAGRSAGNSLLYYGDSTWATSIDLGSSLAATWVHNNFDQAFYPSLYFVYTPAPAGDGTNMQINISDVFKEVDSLSINIGDSWKSVESVQVNVGDTWKSVF